MTKKIIVAAFLISILSGCVVEQAPPPLPPRGVYVPRGVVYVAPAYVAPRPGYIWVYNERFGWGWRHPRYGWYRR